MLLEAEIIDSVFYVCHRDYICIIGLFLTFKSFLWLCEGLNIIMTNNSNNSY